MARAFLLCALGAPAFVAGCQLIGGFETFEEGAGGSTASSATTGSSSTAVPSGCDSGAPPAKGGPVMVAAALEGGHCFWIDKTEVTAKQYAAFVPTADVGSQTPECMGNTSFEPSCGDAGASPQTDEKPVACVDWCDALAFCKSVGKRLCHGDGANNPASAAKSEWFAACSGPDLAYPYAKTYKVGVCNGGCSGASCSLVDVGTLSGCHTASGISDMSGNAAEWVDECDSTAANGNCAVRGGAANSDSEWLKCSGTSPVARLTTNKFIGFRCCADAQ